MDDDVYDGYGKYEISQTCCESFPCHHNVKDTVTGITEMMSGVTIYKMLKKEGLSAPHFDGYGNGKCKI